MMLDTSLLLGRPKFCQVMYKNKGWFTQIVYEVPEQEIKLNGNVMAIDVGIINMATTVDTYCNVNIYSGRQILAIQHYFSKEKAKLQAGLIKQYPKRYWSKNLGFLQKKQNNQIRQALHTYSKKIISDCKKKEIRTIVVGNISDIRNKSWSKVSSQKLQIWPYSKFIRQLRYKATKSGMRFVKADEKYTSQRCITCGIIKKSNRKYRGLYICEKCDNKINSDVVGAINILKKYLQDFLSRSIGNVALPSVTKLENIVSLNPRSL